MNKYKLSHSYGEYSGADYGELWIAQLEDENQQDDGSETVYLKLNRLKAYICGSDPCALPLDDAEWVCFSEALKINPTENAHKFFIDTIPFELYGRNNTTLRINHPDFFPEIHRCCKLLFSDILMQYYAPCPIIYAFESDGKHHNVHLPGRELCVNLETIKHQRRTITKFPDFMHRAEHVWRVTKFSLFTHFRHVSPLQMYAHDCAVRHFCIAWCQPANKYDCKSARSLAANPLFESKLLTAILEFLTISKEAKHLLASKADIYTVTSNLSEDLTIEEKRKFSKKGRYSVVLAGVTVDAGSYDCNTNSDSDGDAKSDSDSDAKSDHNRNNNNKDDSDSDSDDSDDDSAEPIYTPGLQLINQDRKYDDYPYDQLVFLPNLTCIAEPILILMPEELKRLADLKLSQLIKSTDPAIEVLSRRSSCFLAYNGCIYLYKPAAKEIEKYVYHSVAAAYIHIKELIRQLQL